MRNPDTTHRLIMNDQIDDILATLIIGIVIIGSIFLIIYMITMIIEDNSLLLFLIAFIAASWIAGTIAMGSKE